VVVDPNELLIFKLRGMTTTASAPSKKFAQPQPKPQPQVGPSAAPATATTSATISDSGTNTSEAGAAKD